MPNNDLQGQTLRDVGWEFKHEKEVGLGIVGRRHMSWSSSEMKRGQWTFFYSLLSFLYILWKLLRKKGNRVKNQGKAHRQYAKEPLLTSFIWGRSLMLKNPKVLKNRVFRHRNAGPASSTFFLCSSQVQVVGICFESPYKREKYSLSAIHWEIFRVLKYI